MNARNSIWHSALRWGSRALTLLAFTAGIVLLMLWLAGKFAPKTPSGGADQPGERAAPQKVARVQLVSLPVAESAVGAIRAVHETTIGSKLLARVMEVNLKAGQKVAAGEVLIRLDDSDLRAKLQQAKAAEAPADAVRTHAAQNEARYRQLVKDHAISQQEYERNLTALRAAEADVRRAAEAINELQATLDWATIRAPFDGTVIDKKVDVGDMVTPGQTLLTLFDPKRMQLVASVRESLTHRLHVGQSIDVRIEGLNKQCSGEVSEIVPEAQSASRTFQVKVTGPCPTGIYSGMFGRILIPLEREQTLAIPRAAVRNIGQLELVDVVEQGKITRRAVRVGRKLGDIQNAAGQTLLDQVEVLSGLREGESVVLYDPPVEPESKTPLSPRGRGAGGERAATNQETTVSQRPLCPVPPAAQPKQEARHD